MGGGHKDCLMRERAWLRTERDRCFGLRAKISVTKRETDKFGPALLNPDLH